MYLKNEQIKINTKKHGQMSRQAETTQDQKLHQTKRARYCNGKNEARQGHTQCIYPGNMAQNSQDCQANCNALHRNSNPCAFYHS